MIRPVQRDVQQDVLQLRSELEARSVAISDRTVEILPWRRSCELPELGHVHAGDPLAFVERKVRPDAHIRSLTCNSPEPDMLCAEHVRIEGDRGVERRTCVSKTLQHTLIGPRHVLDELRNMERPLHKEIMLSVRCF